MNKQTPLLVTVLRRIACVGIAFLLMFVGGLPLFHSGTAAAAQMVNRSIQMSDSAPSGTSITTGVGSGTDVTYKVTFTASAAADSMVIDFCVDDALIGDTCTFPTNMDFSAATLTAVSGPVGGWAITPTATGIKLSDSVANSAAIDPATQAVQSFEIKGVTNPSSVSATTYGTFYARMYTYADNTFGSSTTAYASPDSTGGGPGDYKDFGGVALVINRVITITARVSEQLTFCLTKVDISTTTTHNCSDTAVSAANNYPALTLGHSATAGGGLVLTQDQVDTGIVYSQLSTNATSGVVVRMRNSNGQAKPATPCGGLSTDGGNTCAIPAVNGGNNTGAAALPAGTAAFGLFVSDYHTETDGVAPNTMTLSPIYHSVDPAHVVTYGTTTMPTSPNDIYYGMDTTSHGSGGDDVTSLYGSELFNVNSPCYEIENQYIFAATASITTPAGVYSANMVVIATGKF